MLDRLTPLVAARLKEHKQHEKTVKDEQRMRPSMTSREVACGSKPMLLTLIKAHIQRLNRTAQWTEVRFRSNSIRRNTRLAKAYRSRRSPIRDLTSRSCNLYEDKRKQCRSTCSSTRQKTGSGRVPTSVTTKTDKFYELIKIDRDTHAPPILRFMWGQADLPALTLTATGRRRPARTDSNASSKASSSASRSSVPKAFRCEPMLSVSLREYYSLEDQIQRINLIPPITPIRKSCNVETPCLASQTRSMTIRGNGGQLQTKPSYRSTRFATGDGTRRTAHSLTYDRNHDS